MLGVVLLPLAMGILVAAILWINEFPDVSADVSVGKKTLMARRSVSVGLEERLKGRKGPRGSCTPAARLMVGHRGSSMIPQ